MLKFELYDDETALRLPEQATEDIALIMEQYGYTCYDHDIDTITFIAE